MIPDAEKAAVEWAKADAVLTALINGRVATRLPKDWESPFLRVVLIDANPDSEADLGSHLLQWDCYAHAPESDKPNYPGASLLARKLVRQAQIFDGGSIEDGYIFGFGSISGPRRMEEPETGWARYMVETLISLRATEGG